MTFLAAPICLGCKHCDRTAPGPGLRCAAFPDGIPVEIFQSRADHRRPFAGDQGIRFEPVNDEDAAYAELLFDAAPHEPDDPLQGDDEVSAVARAEVA